MISHLVLGADDISAAKAFYDAILSALGHSPGTRAGNRVVYAGANGGLLMITTPLDGQAASFGNGSTVGLNAPSPEAVDAFHKAGLAAGGTDAGAPGARDAIPNSYAAYVRDPTGNKLVAWCVRPDA